MSSDAAQVPMKKEKRFHLFRLRKPCKTGNQFVESGMVVFGLATSHSQEMKQVRMADQAMYHQGNQSVFVGGRLWTLLHTHTHLLIA